MDASWTAVAMLEYSGLFFSLYKKKKKKQLQPKNEQVKADKRKISKIIWYPSVSN